MKKLALTLLTAFSALAGSVTFVWNQNTEPDIKEYRLYYKGEGETVQQAVVAFPSTNITVTNIAYGKRYQAYVTAVNTNNVESDPSIGVTFTLPPAKPADFKTKRVVFEFEL